MGRRARGRGERRPCPPPPTPLSLTSYTSSWVASPSSTASNVNWEKEGGWVGRRGLGGKGWFWISPVPPRPLSLSCLVDGRAVAPVHDQGVGLEGEGGGGGKGKRRVSLFAVGLPFSPSPPLSPASPSPWRTRPRGTTPASAAARRGSGRRGGGRSWWGEVGRFVVSQRVFFFFRSRVFIKTPPLFFSRPTASHNSPLSRHTRHAAQTQSEWTDWKEPPPETPPPPAGPPILLSAPSAPLPPAPLLPRRRPAKRQAHAHDASRARRGGRDGTGLLALPHGRARSRPHPHAIPPPSAPPRSCFPVPPSSLPPPQGASWRCAAV